MDTSKLPISRIDELITKLDEINTWLTNLENSKRVIETWSEGTEWYRIWSDGWIEQGGIIGIIPDYGTGLVTLHKNFSNTNYTIAKATQMPASGDDTSYNDATCIRYATKTINNFQIYNRGATDGGRYISWYACGY